MVTTIGLSSVPRGLGRLLRDYDGIALIYRIVDIVVMMTPRG